MEIVLAEVMGFCFGVRRAIEQAEEAVRDSKHVQTLGPLVHNPQEIERLVAAGVHIAHSLDELTGDTAVIRAHGARPETFGELHKRALRIVDATCPFVTNSQNIAREAEREGYTLVIVGHPDHPEVQGILGYVSSPAYVITRPDEVDTLPDGIKPQVIAQTTVNEQTFREVIEAIAQRYPDNAVRNTVCSATRERQSATRDLAAQVEAIYIIGGRASSNTNRLSEICRQTCPRTFLIETADEIDPQDLAGVQRVGVTAGASTPDWLIEQVVERLRSMQ